MRVEIEDFQTGWHGLTIGINTNDIDKLIGLLAHIKKNKDEHFHICSGYEGEGGIGDIEFYIQNEDDPDNMRIE